MLDTARVSEQITLQLTLTFLLIVTVSALGVGAVRPGSVRRRHRLDATWSRASSYARTARCYNGLRNPPYAQHFPQRHPACLHRRRPGISRGPHVEAFRVHPQPGDALRAQPCPYLQIAQQHHVVPGRGIGHCGFLLGAHRRFTDLVLGYHQPGQNGALAWAAPLLSPFSS